MKINHDLHDQDTYEVSTIQLVIASIICLAIMAAGIVAITHVFF